MQNPPKKTLHLLNRVNINIFKSLTDKLRTVDKPEFIIRPEFGKQLVVNFKAYQIKKQTMGGEYKDWQRATRWLEGNPNSAATHCVYYLKQWTEGEFAPLLYKKSLKCWSPSVLYSAVAGGEPQFSCYALHCLASVKTEDEFVPLKNS